MAMKYQRTVTNVYADQRDRLRQTSPLYNDEDWKRIATGNARDATLDSYIYALDKMPTSEKELKQFKDDYLYDYAKSSDRVLSLYNEVYADREKAYVRDDNQLYKKDKGGNYLVKAGKDKDGNDIIKPASEVPNAKEQDFIKDDTPYSDYEYYKRLLQEKNNIAYEQYLLKVKEDLKASQNAGEKIGAFLGSVAGEFFVSGVVHQLNSIGNFFYGIGSGANEFLRTGDLEAASKARIDATMEYDKNSAFSKFEKMFIDWELENSSFRDLTTGEYTTVGKYLGTSANTLGKMIPSVVVSLIGGKIGGALNGTAGKLVSKGTEVVSSGLFYAGFDADQIIETYNFVSQHGISISNASLLHNVDTKMFLQWLVEAGLDKFLGATNLDNMAFGRAAKAGSFKSIHGNAVMRLLKDAWQEGTEEVLQDLSDYLVDRIYAVAVDENFGKLSQFNAETIYDSYTIAVLTSLIGAGGRIATTKRIKTDAIKYDKAGNPITIKKLTKEDGKLVLKDTGDVKTKKLDQFASWEYGLTLQDFFRMADDVLKRRDSSNSLFTLYKDYKKGTTKEDKKLQKDIKAVYEVYRVLTDYYTVVGQDRFMQANELLTMIQNAPSRDNVYSVIEENVGSMVKNLRKIGLFQNNEDYRQLKLHEQLIKNENTELVNAYQKGKAKGTKELEHVQDDLQSVFDNTESAEINNKEDAKVKKVVKKVLDDNPAVKTVVVTKKGSMTYDEETGTLFVGVNNITMDESGNLLYAGIAEDVIINDFVMNIAKGTFNGFSIEKLTDLYKKWKGVEEVDPTTVIATLMFDTNFLIAVLPEMDFDTYKFVGSFKEFVKTLLNKKADNYKELKKKLLEVTNNIKMVLREYCVYQINARTDISLFDKEDINYIKQKRAPQEIHNRIVDGIFAEYDLNVIKRQITFLPDLSYDEKVKLFEDVQSKDKQTRFNAMLLLSNSLETVFYNDYNGKIYMPMTSIPNRLFNDYLQATGLTIQTLDKPANKSEETAIMNVQGVIAPATCLAYHKDMFERRTNHRYVFDFNDNNQIVIYEKKDYKLIPVGFSANDIINTVPYQTAEGSTVVEGPVYNENWKNKMFNKNVDNATKAYCTVDDLILHPEYLNDNIRSNILREYGVINSDTTALVLRKMFLDDSKGKITIVMSRDGIYTLASVTDMIKVLKNNNFAKKDLRDGMLLSEVFEDKYLLNGTQDAKIIFDTDTSKAEYRTYSYDDASGTAKFDNNIYINPKTIRNDEDLRFTICHEFQHIIQNNNMINTGFDANWLFNVIKDVKIRNEIVKDIIAHKPEMFKGLNTSLSSNNKEDRDKVYEIANDYVYYATGESQAYGLEGTVINNFSPVLVRRSMSAISIVMPWGKSYNIAGKDAFVTSSAKDCVSYTLTNDKNYPGFKSLFHNSNKNTNFVQLDNITDENWKPTQPVATFLEYAQNQLSYYGYKNNLKADDIIPICYIETADSNILMDYDEAKFMVGLPEGKPFDYFVSYVFNNKGRTTLSDRFRVCFGYKYFKDLSSVVGVENLTDLTQVTYLADAVDNAPGVWEFPDDVKKLFSNRNGKIFKSGVMLRDAYGKFTPVTKIKYDYLDLNRKYLPLDYYNVRRFAAERLQLEDELTISETESNEVDTAVRKLIKDWDSEVDKYKNETLDFDDRFDKHVYEKLKKEYRKRNTKKLNDLTNKWSKVISEIKTVPSMILNYEIKILKDFGTRIENLYHDSDLEKWLKIFMADAYKKDLERIQSTMASLARFLEEYVSNDSAKEFRNDFDVFKPNLVRSNIKIINDLYLPSSFLALKAFAKRFGVQAEISTNIRDKMEKGGLQAYGVQYDGFYDDKVPHRVDLALLNIYEKLDWGYAVAGEIDKIDPEWGEVLEDYDISEYSDLVEERSTFFNVVLHEIVHSMVYDAVDNSYYKEKTPYVLKLVRSIYNTIFERLENYNNFWRGIATTLSKKGAYKKGNLLHNNRFAANEITARLVANQYIINWTKIKSIDPLLYDELKDISRKVDKIWQSLGVVRHFGLSKKWIDEHYMYSRDDGDVVKTIVDFSRQSIKKYDDSIMPEHLAEAKNLVKKAKEEGIKFQSKGHTVIRKNVDITKVTEEKSAPGALYTSKLVATYNWTDGNNETHNDETITLKYFRAPRVGEYVSRTNRKDTNLRYFKRSQIPKSLQHFVINANKDKLAPELWSKIEDGTLVLDDLKTWMRDTPYESMDEYTFNMVKNAIPEWRDSKISSPQELQTFVDDTGNFYALQSVINIMLQNGDVTEDFARSIGQEKDMRVIKKLVDKLKEYDMLKKIYENYKNYFNSTLLKKVFNKLNTKNSTFANISDRFSSTLADKEGANDKYLRTLWLKFFDGTIQSTTAITHIIKATFRMINWKLTGEVKLEQSPKAETKEGDELDVMENIDSGIDMDEQLDSWIFREYVTSQDEEDILVELLDDISLKYVYDMYKKYKDRWDTIVPEKFKEHVSKKREEQIQRLGKLFNMDKAQLKKEQRDMAIFIAKLGLDNATEEELARLNEYKENDEKVKYMANLAMFGKKALTDFVTNITLRFYGKQVGVDMDTEIVDAPAPKDFARRAIDGINHIINTIENNVIPKQYKFIVKANNDIFELKKGRVPRIVLKKDAYLDDKGEIDLTVEEIELLHNRVKELSKAIRDGSDFDIGIYNAGKENYKEMVKQLKAEVKEAKKGQMDAAKTAKRLSDYNEGLMEENLKLRKTIMAYENATFTIDGNRKMPDKLNALLTEIFHNTRESEMQHMKDIESKQYIQTTISKFLEMNDTVLSSLTQDEVNEIIDFFAHTPIVLNDSSARIFSATEIAVLTYILSVHENKTGSFTLEKEQVIQIEKLLMNIISPSAENLGLWKGALNYLRKHAVSIIVKSSMKKYGLEYEGMDKDVDNILVAIRTRNIERMQEAKNTMYRHALKHVVGTKQSIWDRLLRFQKASMLSGPGTWVRNQVSDANLTAANTAGEWLGKLFSKIFPKNLKLAEDDPLRRQYVLVGTKIDNDVRRFIQTAIIDSGFFELFDDSMTKFDPRKNTKLSKTQDMLANIIVDRLATQAKIDGSVVDVFTKNKINKFMKNELAIELKQKDGTTTKPLTYNEMTERQREEAFVQIVGSKTPLKMYYSFVYKMLSDRPWIKKAFIKYFGKMLTEDNADIAKCVKLDGSIELTTEVINIMADAFVLASRDYMHKTNFVYELESRIRQKFGPAGHFLYKQIFPFLGPSLNWAYEGLKLSPLGLIKAIVDYAKLEKTIQKTQERVQAGERIPSARLTQYLVQRDIGKGILGTIGWVIGVVLAATGAARIDDEDDKFKLVVGDTYVDISGIFGSQGIMQGIVAAGMIRAGTKDGKSFEDILFSTLNGVFDQMFIDTSFSDLFNSFRYSDSISEYLSTIPYSSMSMFIPNFIKYLNFTNKYTVNYERGIVGKLERLAVQMIPSISYALPHKIDPYTGEDQVQYRWWFLTQMFNKSTPIKIYPYNVSEMEKLAISLGVNRSALSGNYTVNGESVNLKKEQVDSANKLYGSLNKKTLENFVNNKTEFRVQTKDGTYVTLRYIQMTDEQKKNVINRIMNDNAEISKIYILTSTNTYKYYANEEMYNELIKLGIKKNVYKETNKKEGFIKI